MANADAWATIVSAMIGAAALVIVAIIARQTLKDFRQRLRIERQEKRSAEVAEEALVSIYNAIDACRRIRNRYLIPKIETKPDSIHVIEGNIQKQKFSEEQFVFNNLNKQIPMIKSYFGDEGAHPFGLFRKKVLDLEFSINFIAQTGELLGSENQVVVHEPEYVAKLQECKRIAYSSGNESSDEFEKNIQEICRNAEAIFLPNLR